MFSTSYAQIFRVTAYTESMKSEKSSKNHDGDDRNIGDQFVSLSSLVGLYCERFLNTKVFACMEVTIWHGVTGKVGEFPESCHHVSEPRCSLSCICRIAASMRCSSVYDRHCK